MAESDHEHGLHVVAISDEVEKTARRIARVWSTTAVLLFLILAVTVGIPQGPDAEPWERTVQIATLALLGASVLLSWLREGLGGAIMLVAAIGLWALSALQHQPVISFLPAILFIVPATSFLVAWNRTKTRAAVVFLTTTVVMVLIVGGAVARVTYDHGYGAAHPESQLPAVPETPVVWLWSGAVTDTGATVVVRAQGENVAIALEPADGTTAVTHDGDVWRFAITGLVPGTEYLYTAIVDEIAVHERSGVFSTFATVPQRLTIAAASCARLGSNGQVYEAIVAADPDLFIFTGDMFYADYVETAEHYEHAYESSLTQPAQAHLLSSVPIAYVWDDHDYGRNNSDRTMPTRDLALTAYFRNVPHYPLAAPDAIYQHFTVGRVQVVLLDDRSHRDPNSDPDGVDKTMLGDAQQAWLEDRLVAGRDEYALTILINQAPWISESSAGADHWGGYTAERAEIADFIAANDIRNILMVSGDAHMLAIDDGTNTDYSALGNASFPLLHAAALDRPGSVKGGPYSEGAFPGGGQFGLIEIVDNGGDSVSVHLSGIDWRGEVRVDHSFEVVVP